MPLHYKIDILSSLKEKGYSTYKLRNERLLSEGALTSLRQRAPISWSNIERICGLLNCQPGDLIEFVAE